MINFSGLFALQAPQPDSALQKQQAAILKNQGQILATLNQQGKNQLAFQRSTTDQLYQQQQNQIRLEQAMGQRQAWVEGVQRLVNTNLNTMIQQFETLKSQLRSQSFANR